MTDNVSKEQRSATMAKVKSTGNRTTEVIVEAALLRFGIIGWEKHPDLPGKPDFYFPSLRLMLFVDGCYWHGCPKHVRRPTSNTEYWKSETVG
jgi:DNA mismatch endonuclease (patch repair protein)